MKIKKNKENSKNPRTDTWHSL